MLKFYLTLFTLIILFFSKFTYAQCTIDIDGSTHKIKTVYAIKIPDPFAENKEITRLIWVQNPLTSTQLSDELKMIQAFHAEGQKGVFVDIKNDGKIISVRLSWDELSTMWSGEQIQELHFEGKLDSKRVAGKVSTDPPLGVYGKEVKWTIFAKIKEEIRLGWQK